MTTWKDWYPGIENLNIEPMGAAFDGNPTLDELDALFKIAVYTRAQTVFEIGTFTRTTARALAALPEIKKVWTLDLPEGIRPILPILSSDWRWIGVPKAPLIENIIQLWGDSASFDFQDYARQCDLVFVMGAHSPEYIHNDLSVAQELIGQNGAIVLHTGTEENFERIKNDYQFAMITNRMAVVLNEA